MKEHITAHSHIQICRGSDFCRNAIFNEDLISGQILASAQNLESHQLPAGIIDEPILRHRFFSASISFCPNACTRPQTADFGVIAASIISKTDSSCSNCRACVKACRESAIDMSLGSPEIVFDKCIQCGSCISRCPCGTIISAQKGFRVLIGGTMGRHPRFASELPGIYNPTDVIGLFEVCYSMYNNLFNSGLRFREMILHHPENIPPVWRETFQAVVR